MRALRLRAALWGSCLLVGCGEEDPTAAPAGEGEAVLEAAATSENRPPTIEKIGLEPANPRPGERLVARVVADDPDGDALALEYVWSVAGEIVAARGGSLHVRGERGAEIEVQVVARDAAGESEPATARAEIGNLPPAIVQVVIMPLGEISAGSDITASPRATDPEGDPLEFHYRWTVDGSELSEDTPTLSAEHFERGDSIELQVVATDGIDESEPISSPPIQVVNAPPRITSSPGDVGPDGVFRYALAVEDPDGDRGFRYRLLRGPGGMSLGSDGTLLWDPGSSPSGSHPVEIEVEDRLGARTLQRFAIQLAQPGEEGPPAAPAP